MTETILTYPSCDGSHTLTAVLFWPEQEVRAIVQILHGVAEHIGRYRRFAEALTAKGFLVCGANHLGHGAGLDDQSRGFFAERDGWNIVANDCVALAERMKKDYPTLPYVLFGHSMGSFLARTIYLGSLFPADAVVLSGTGHMPGIVIGAGKLLGKGELWRLKSKQAESPLLDKIVFGSYNKAFSKCADGHDWISSLPEEVARYEADPDCGYKVKLGLFLDLFDGLSYITDKRNFKGLDKETPLLLLSGEDDPVGGNGKGVRAACRAFCNAGCRDVSLLLYPSCRHEILNDFCRERVIEDFENWFNERFPV